MLQSIWFGAILKVKGNSHRIMKRRTGLLGFSAAGLAAAFFIAASLSLAGATYFTNADNENNAGTGTPDNDMGVILGRTSPIAPIEFNINVAAPPTTSARLTVRAYDVDEEQGQIDLVYFNGNLLGKLTGANEVDSTTVFEVPIAFVNAGNNRVRVEIDTSGDSTPWVVRIDWAQLLIDGGAADQGNASDLEITGYSIASGTVTISTARCIEAAPSPGSPPDTDADATPDYRDRDSDGDRLPDALEGGGVGRGHRQR